MTAHLIADAPGAPGFGRRRLLSRARYAAIVPGRPDPDPPQPVPPGPPPPGDPVPGDPGPTDPPAPPPEKRDPDLPPNRPPRLPIEDRPPLKLWACEQGTDPALLGYPTII